MNVIKRAKRRAEITRTSRHFWEKDAFDLSDPQRFRAMQKKPSGLAFENRQGLLHLLACHLALLQPLGACPGQDKGQRAGRVFRLPTLLRDVDVWAFGRRFGDFLLRRIQRMFK